MEKQKSTTPPLVSIIIITYNSGEYLKPTLESVLGQTFHDFEVLILDNNSKDKTKEVIESFDDARIKLYPSDTNLGPYKGINYVLNKARGKYIAIQDHDDLWIRNKLELQVEFLENNSEYLGCGSAATMFYEENQSSFVYTFPLQSNYTIHPSVLFRNIPGLAYNVEIDYMADAYFLKQVLCKGKNRIYNFQESLMTHLIKGSGGNYSYKWFKVDSKHIRRVFEVHGMSFYSLAVIGFEMQRKVLYPLLNWMKWYGVITKIEQMPFRLMGFRVKKGEL